MTKQEKIAYRTVLKRDKKRCVICGNHNIEIHHIIYRSLQGATIKENMVCLCKKHHMDYHARGKEGTEELIDMMRLHYGCIERNDLKKQDRYKNFKYSR